MHFETYESRKETLAQARFEEFLKDPEFSSAVAALEKEMEFITDDGDELASRMEQGPNFMEAMKEVQRRLDALLLDAREMKVTQDAIANAVAQKLDPDGSKGYTDVVS